MDEFVTKAVHEEFAKRIDEENTRQNHRISILEAGLAQINDLASSVKVLAVNMENMAKEQAKQGEKLSEIEGRPAKRWETVVIAILTGIVGFALNALLTGAIK